jgi:hypothetical protein
MGAKGGLDLKVMSLIQEFREAYDLKQIVIAELTRDHDAGYRGTDPRPWHAGPPMRQCGALHPLFSVGGGLGAVTLATIEHDAIEVAQS